LPELKKMMTRKRTGLSVFAATLLAAADFAVAAEEDAGIIPGAAEGLAPAIATLLIFIILVVVLGKYAWGPIVSGLTAREEKIRKDISDAEAARERAEATLREYNQQLATAEEKVRELIARATADGERVAANIRTRAQEEAEEIKARALRDIDTSKKQALAEIYEQAAELATAMAEKILGRNLNTEDQRDLVNRSLEQLQTLKG
jgi:F-type H+-transporting ATPase subunit b